MYRSPALAELMQHHLHYSNTDEGIMKSVVESLAWKHVKTLINSSFGDEDGKLCFGMSLDGINPFPQSHTTYLTWVVLMIIVTYK